jgi:hypothetical protein
LGKEYPLGRSFGPMFKGITELAMVFAKGLPGANMNDAVSAFFKNDVRLAEPDRSQWCGSGSRDL